MSYLCQKCKKIGSTDFVSVMDKAFGKVLRSWKIGPRNSAWSTGFMLKNNGQLMEANDLSHILEANIWNFMYLKGLIFFQALISLLKLCS